MKRHRLVHFAILTGLCTWVMAGQHAAAKSRRSPGSAVRPQPKGADTAVDATTGVKLVHYGDKDIVRLKTKLRFNTLVILPKNEKILDITCGDKELWVANAVENLAFIKPAKGGIQTNLNLITASGNIYSFLVTEISELGEGTPDLKVFVEPKDESMISTVGGNPKFVSAQSLDDYRQQVAIAKEETRQIQQSAQNAIDTGISRFVSNMRFPYRFEAGKRPFNVRAMYTDDKFTYIQARPEELPALYEVQDGKPSLVNFEYRNGVYVVEKTLDRGYLTIGKQKLIFVREE